MKKIIYIALISLTALVSCSRETLNPVPSNAVSDEQIFSSVESAQTALNSGMAYIGHYLSITLGTVMAEVMGEDAAMSSGAYGFPKEEALEIANMIAGIIPLKNLIGFNPPKVLTVKEYTRTACIKYPR